jgi:hypothetical protein
MGRESGAGTLSWSSVFLLRRVLGIYIYILYSDSGGGCLENLVVSIAMIMSYSLYSSFIVCGFVPVWLTRQLFESFDQLKSSWLLSLATILRGTYVRVCSHALYLRILNSRSVPSTFPNHSFSASQPIAHLTPDTPPQTSYILPSNIDPPFTARIQHVYTGRTHPHQ